MPVARIQYGGNAPAFRVCAMIINARRSQRKLVLPPRPSRTAGFSARRAACPLAPAKTRPDGAYLVAAGAQSQALAACDENLFNGELNAAARNVFGQLHLIGARALQPLGLKSPKPLSARAWPWWVRPPMSSIRWPDKA